MSYIHHRHYPLAVTVPRLTSSFSPVQTFWALTQGILHSIKVRVPPGHNGLTGFKVLYQGQQIMPWDNNTWEIGSGDTFGYAWDAEIMPSGISLVTYNTDRVAHTFYATADMTPDLGKTPVTVMHPQIARPPSRAAVAAIAGLAG